tara:strand:+ start:261 stop:452 length:192 start_codon:yes stop_codon:yes gene_type:complete
MIRFYTHAVVVCGAALCNVGYEFYKFRKNKKEEYKQDRSIPVTHCYPAEYSRTKGSNSTGVPL